MKNLIRLKIIAVIIAFTSLTISCDDEISELNTAINDVDLTTMGILKGNPTFSQFVKAIELAGLTETLKNNEPYTLFAPRNDAFNSFLITTPYKTINEIPKDDLKQIVLYHVLKNQILAKDFTIGSVETLATATSLESNLSINVNTTAGVVLNGSVKVVFADFTAPNGVVHIVDKVIPLPN
jgi:uncharacterized surface protein with fasciclin (FAS1) repeats